MLYHFRSLVDPQSALRRVCQKQMREPIRIHFSGIL